jgi:hypothetical protein
MNTKIKFIGQYNASICGTHNTEVIDIFCNESKGEMYLYRSNTNGDFSFEVIEKNIYNSNPKYNKFDSLLKDPNSYIGIQLFVAWRVKYVQIPKLMPERYYYDILNFHIQKEKIMSNKIKYVKDNLYKCINKTVEELER